MKLSDWKGVPLPERVTLNGRYARLEPLETARHGEALWSATRKPAEGERFRYLFEEPPADRAVFAAWLEKVSISTDPLFFAVVDKQSDRAEGRQALLRMDSTHGVIEVGHIWWGTAIARTRVATEALYLFARHVFETLGYRRLEWKCNDLNEPSKRAARRFGFRFEGVFRHHMVVKGQNRDTAWFAMLDADWPRLKAGYETWLQPGNFDEAGQQRGRLAL